MEPKIGIVICGFTGDRQFVTNPYIQSVRYSHGLPIVLPLVRSDRVLAQYVELCDGFLFCGGGDITPLLFGEEPKKREWKDMHHCGSLSDPPHEKDSFIRETCIRDLPRHAGAKRGLRWHDLAGHVPHSRPRPRPYAAVCLPRRGQPPDTHRAWNAPP